MPTRKQQIESLTKLMKKIDIAMLTTVGAGGYLVSRPLSTQAAEFDGEAVWFFTEADSPKAAEIRRNPRVNVAYASKDANTYISAAGDARINRDQARIDRLWNDALKAFFPNGPDDPNLTLIEVQLRTIEYWDGPGTWLGKAITFVVARVTGNDDVMGENRIVDLATGRSHKPPGSDGARKASKRTVASALSGRKNSATKRTVKRKPATTKAPAKKKVAKKAPASKRAAKRAAPAKTAARKSPARKAR